MTSREHARAVSALHAILAYREYTRCNYEDCLSQLLCDLMHWAHLSNFDFEAALDCARLDRDARVP